MRKPRHEMMGDLPYWPWLISVTIHNKHEFTEDSPICDLCGAKWADVLKSGQQCAGKTDA